MLRETIAQIIYKQFTGKTKDGEVWCQPIAGVPEKCADTILSDPSLREGLPEIKNPCPCECYEIQETKICICVDKLRYEAKLEQRKVDILYYAAKIDQARKEAVEAERFRVRPIEQAANEDSYEKGLRDGSKVERERIIELIKSIPMNDYPCAEIVAFKIGIKEE